MNTDNIAPRIAALIEKAFADAVRSSPGTRDYAVKVSDEETPIESNLYSSTIDLNLALEGAGYGSRLLHNSGASGSTAKRALNTLSSCALWSAYLGIEGESDSRRPPVFFVEKDASITLRAFQAAAQALRDDGILPIDGHYVVELPEEWMFRFFQDPDIQEVVEELLESRISCELVSYAGDGVYTFKFHRLYPLRFGGLEFVPSAHLRNMAIIYGKGAVVESPPILDKCLMPDVSYLTYCDGICLETRPPLDGFSQTVSQTWSWAGGFAAPTDDGHYRRARIIQSR
jgi:hypothetical protein